MFGIDPSKFGITPEMHQRYHELRREGYSPSEAHDIASMEAQGGGDQFGGGGGGGGGPPFGGSSIRHLEGVVVVPNLEEVEVAHLEAAVPYFRAVVVGLLEATSL
jgi:hypothetical protein